MDGHLLNNIPDDIGLRILEIYAQEMMDSVAGLMEFSQLRMASKKFNLIINDEFICRYFMRTLLRKFSKVYLPTTIANIFKQRDISAFRSVYNSMKAKDRSAASKIYKNYFWLALKEADVDFVREYLSIGKNTEDPLSHDKILNAIEVANEREDRSDIMLFLLPYLVSFIPDVDPNHIDIIKLSVMYGIKLTIEPEFKKEFTAMIGATEKTSTTNLDSSLLMRLLEPKKRKVVIPAGRILGPTRATDLYSDPKQDYKKGNPKFTTVNFDLPKDSCIIHYITANNTKKSIAFSKNNGVFEYEEVKTPNLYELFVRSSIFSQILDSFPHQHVAFTEEAMKLHFEEQPWFFGALSDEEVERIISGAAGQKTMLMRSVGSNIYMHFSKSHRDPVTLKPHRFNYDQNLWQEFNSDSLRKLHFHTGFYNGGFVKDLPIFQFFKAIDKGDFDEIQYTFLSKRIDPAHPTFQHQNILLAYLIKNQVANEDIIEWMIDMKFPLNIDLEMLKRLLKNVGVSVKTIKKCWHLVDESIDATALVGDYLSEVQSTSTSIISFPQYAQYFKTKNSRRTLVNLAWRYGNEENYFKMLPPEIVEMICRFNLDPTRWEEIAEFLLEKATNQIEFGTTRLPMDLLLKFGNFFCDNFTRFTEKSHSGYVRNIVEHLETASKYVQFDAFGLLNRYILKLKSYYNSRTHLELNEALHLCLKTASHVTETDKKLNLTKKTQARDLLKVLLDIKPLREFHRTGCSFSDFKRTDRMPCFWRAIGHKNIDAIEYLVKNNWMPLQYPSTTRLSATEYACISGHTDLVAPLMAGNTTKQ